MRSIESFVRHLALGMLTALGLIACGGGSLEPPASARLSEPQPLPSLQPAVDRFPADPHWRLKKTPQALKPHSRPSTLEVELPANTPALTRRAAQTGGHQPKALAVGKPIEDLSRPEDVSRRLIWRTTTDGRHLAQVSIRSPGAVGVRVAIDVGQLPTDATLSFAAPGAAGERAFTGAQIQDTMVGSMATSGNGSTPPRRFWSPTVDGSELAMSIELPAHHSPQAVALSLPMLSHFYLSPADPQADNTPKIGEAATCNADATCYPEWRDISNATAKLVFTDSFGDSFLCSGTLLNDRASSLTPYLLTANHCIDNAGSAASVETLWFYRSRSCGSSQVDSSHQTRSGGATLLHTSASTDVTLLRLNATPPAGAIYAGWDPNTLAAGVPLTGLHHPLGDLQKISLGVFRSFCSGSVTSVLFACNSLSSSNFFDVRFTTGTTEQGSSGSGIFRTGGDGGKYLVGQLWGGSSSCSNTEGSNVYGSFATSYDAGLKQWLDAGVTPTPISFRLDVSRTGTGSGTVTSTPDGISCGTQCAAQFASGTSVSLLAQASSGSQFVGWSGACSGTGACVVTMNTARSVIAEFRITSVTPAPINSVTNGGFESGATGWSASNAGMIVANPSWVTPASTGSRTLAWICGYDACAEQISQDITLPASANVIMLTFKYWVDTFEASLSTAYDKLMVNLVVGGTTRTLVTLSNLTTSGFWQSFSANLSEYAGRTVRLVFAGTTDSSETTSFFIDDVAITATTSTGALPDSGWWWNPNESGRGFAIERQGSQLFLSGFMYETTGEATWYASTLTRQSDGAYEGTLYRYQGGQSLTGGYRTPGAPQTVGQARLSLSSSSEGSLRIVPTSGSTLAIDLQRLNIASFATTTASFENGWWWNPQESGRGYFIEVQGSQTFVAMFGYESSGRPTWYALSTAVLGRSVISAPFDQYAGGQSLLGTYKTPWVIGSPGNVTFSMTGSSTGVLLLPNGQPVTLQRFRFGD